MFYRFFCHFISSAIVQNFVSSLTILNKGNAEQSQKAFERALELIDLTIKYGRLHEPGRRAMLREVCLMREIFCTEYLSPAPDALKSFDKYFMQFGIAAQLRRHRLAAAKRFP